MGKLLIPTVSTMHPLNHAFCTPNFANIGEFLINFGSWEKEIELMDSTSLLTSLRLPMHVTKHLVERFSFLFKIYITILTKYVCGGSIDNIASAKLGFIVM